MINIRTIDNWYLYWHFDKKTGFSIRKSIDRDLRVDKERFDNGNYFNTRNLWLINDIINNLNKHFELLKHVN